jgi:hypothetical protein
MFHLPHVRLSEPTIIGQVSPPLIKRKEIQDVSHMWLRSQKHMSRPCTEIKNIESQEEVGYLKHRKLATQLPFDSIYEGAANLAVCRDMQCWFASFHRWCYTSSLRSARSVANGEAVNGAENARFLLFVLKSIHNTRYTIHDTRRVSISSNKLRTDPV